jgi:hypothetical protein
MSSFHLISPRDELGPTARALSSAAVRFDFAKLCCASGALARRGDATVQFARHQDGMVAAKIEVDLALLRERGLKIEPI